jgi:hypothetical protein
MRSGKERHVMNHRLSEWNVVWLILGFLMITDAAWSSDSIVGWTTSETVVSDGKKTISSGTIHPIYMAPDIGKYILIDGKRYVSSGDHRFVLQHRKPSSTQDVSENTAVEHHRSRKHHHHSKDKKESEDWKRIDAERNASMTPSQKIYRDLKKKIYPELFEK